MTNQRMQVIGFFTLLLLVLLVVALMWLPYLKMLAMGAILAILFAPVNKYFLKKIKSPTFSALLTTLLVLLIIAIPVYFIGQAFYNEIFSLINNVKSNSSTLSWSALAQRLPSQLQGVSGALFADLGQKILSYAANIFSGIKSIISNLASLVLALVLIFFSVFFLTRDSEKIINYFNSVFPLSQDHENRLISKLNHSISGVLKGLFLVALVQGTVATVGFLIFGMPQPFLWGAFTVIAALVPNIGTTVSMVPAVIVLFLSGSTGPAIGLVIWGAAAVGTIDNVISPHIIGTEAKMHPLLVLFSIVGGLKLFGLIGFLLGPIIMAVFLTLLDIYRTDLKVYLEK